MPLSSTNTAPVMSCPQVSILSIYHLQHAHDHLSSDRQSANPAPAPPREIPSRPRPGRCRIRPLHLQARCNITTQTQLCKCGPPAATRKAKTRLLGPHRPRPQGRMDDLLLDDHLLHPPFPPQHIRYVSPLLTSPWPSTGVPAQSTPPSAPFVFVFALPASYPPSSVLRNLTQAPTRRRCLLLVAPRLTKLNDEFASPSVIFPYPANATVPIPSQQAFF
jgi:hypothetical protein